METALEMKINFLGVVFVGYSVLSPLFFFFSTISLGFFFFSESVAGKLCCGCHMYYKCILHLKEQNSTAIL